MEYVEKLGLKCRSEHFGGDVGFEDEYQLEDLDVVPKDFFQMVGVGNFRNSWEAIDAELERVDDYGLGKQKVLWKCTGHVSAIIAPMLKCFVFSS